MHVGDAVAVAGEVEQQRGGNVVRQVADQLERAVADAAEIEGQRVALVDGQPLGRDLAAQAADDVAVDFHNMQMV
ncbi:hypothetical protein D3C85_1328500 [compost metagenome]